MPIANEMKHIAEGIEVSHGERVAFLSDLFKDTNETLRTFHREQEKMSTDLWDFLTSDRDNREKVTASLRGKNKRDLKEMADQLASFLKESTSSMRRDTDGLMAQIRQDINSMETEIAGLLSRFNKDRQSMGKEMKQELISTTRQRIEEVKKMLTTFSGEDEARSRQLRRQLAGFQKQLETTVKEIRAPVILDLREARQNWQNLARIMAAKRAGETAGFKPEKPEIAEAEVAEAVSSVKLKVQLMGLISAATSGVSLSQMAKTLGIPYIRLAKPVSELIKAGEVKKQDSKYLKA